MADAAGRASKQGLVQQLLLLIIALYRHSLGLLIGGRCRFYPSCSDYGRQVIATHGAARGSLMAGARILRCHPFHPGGHDPAPPARQPLNQMIELNR